MKRRPPWFYRQAGVIAYRHTPAGHLEMLLITSRGRGRWIIPKGVIDPGTTALETACKEAYEEAGVRGEASPEALGQYRYEKWGGTCKVTVFALKVSRVWQSWPEEDIRQRKWLSAAKAAEAVEKGALRKLIKRCSASLVDSPRKGVTT